MYNKTVLWSQTTAKPEVQVQNPIFTLPLWIYKFTPIQTGWGEKAEIFYTDFNCFQILQYLGNKAKLDISMAIAF